MGAAIAVAGATGGFFGGDFPRQLPWMMTSHCAEPSTGLRTGGGPHGSRGRVVVSPGVALWLPGEPGVVVVAPRDTPPESTVLVMLGHSPLVLLP